MVFVGELGAPLWSDVHMPVVGRPDGHRTVREKAREPLPAAAHDLEGRGVVGVFLAGHVGGEVDVREVEEYQAVRLSRHRSYGVGGVDLVCPGLEAAAAV